MVGIAIAYLIVKLIFATDAFEEKVGGVLALVKDIGNTIGNALCALVGIITTTCISVIISRVKINIAISKLRISKQKHIAGVKFGLTKFYEVGAVKPSAGKVVISIGILDVRFAARVAAEVLAVVVEEPVGAIAAALRSVKTGRHPQRLFIIIGIESCIGTSSVKTACAAVVATARSVAVSLGNIGGEDIIDVVNVIGNFVGKLDIEACIAARHAREVKIDLDPFAGFAYIGGALQSVACVGRARTQTQDYVADGTRGIHHQCEPLRTVESEGVPFCQIATILNA